MTLASRFRPWRPFAATLLASALLLGCIEPPSSSGVTRRSPGDDAYTWVLLIGNSHSYVNDMPALIEAVCDLAGFPDVRVDIVAGPGFSLEDHWALGDAQRALRNYTWDFVALQQGPSSLPENQLHLREWSIRYAELIRDAEGIPLMYQVWPQLARRQDAANVRTSYTLAAAAIDGLLAPAGDAFTLAMQTEIDWMVYASDGTHASMYGSYLAALTIGARIVGFDPLTLPPIIPGSGAQEGTVRLLQEAAAAALARNAAYP
jgi:hypothetical protein